MPNPGSVSTAPTRESLALRPHASQASGGIEWLLDVSQPGPVRPQGVKVGRPCGSNQTEVCTSHEASFFSLALECAVALDFTGCLRIGAGTLRMTELMSRDEDAKHRLGINCPDA